MYRSPPAVHRFLVPANLCSASARKAARANLTGADPILACDYLEQQRDIGCRAPHRSCTIESRIDSDDPGIRHEAVRWFEADDSAPGRRYADRAALVAADRYINVRVVKCGAEPPEDPPARWTGLWGFRVGPLALVSPPPENAKLSMLRMAVIFLPHPEYDG